jgi:hypothetical protein
MQVQLGRWEQVTLHGVTVKIDHHNLLSREAREVPARGSDRDNAVDPLGDVARRAVDEAVSGEALRRARDSLPRRLNR